MSMNICLQFVSFDTVYLCTFPRRWSRIWLVSIAFKPVIVIYFNQFVIVVKNNWRSILRDGPYLFNIGYLVYIILNVDVLYVYSLILFWSQSALIKSACNISHVTLAHFVENTNMYHVSVFSLKILGYDF